MKSRQYSVETIVELLYRGLLGRAPDPAGFASNVNGHSSVEPDVEHLTNYFKGWTSGKEYRARSVRQWINQLLPNHLAADLECYDIISLGSHCLVAQTLKEMGIRQYSTPFDWIFSSPKMVEHCMSDKFRIFMDPSYYSAIIGPDGAPEIGRCDHMYYKENFGINRMFNHRDMRVPNNYGYMERCITRFLNTLYSDKQKLFVLFTSHPNLGAVVFESLWNSLDSLTTKFSLFFVQWSSEKVGVGLAVRQRLQGSLFAEMTSISKPGPLNFEDPLDDFVFRRGILLALEEISKIARTRASS